MRRAALVAAVFMGGAGCFGSSGEEPKSAPALTTTSRLPAAGPGPTGRFFAQGGEDLLNAGLYELSFGPPMMRPVTKVTRISTIGACPTRLVVAAAQEDVDFVDRLQQFRHDGFGPVPGLGTPNAHDPVLHSDCRMLYYDVDRSDPQRLVFRLHVWDPEAGTDTVVHAVTEGETNYDWGPGGRIGILVRPLQEPGGPTPAAEGIVIIEPDGSRRSLPAPDPTVSGLVWGATGWMAMGSAENGTVFLQPDTGERRDLAGWGPLAWSPDGGQILMAEIGNDRSLGVLDLADLTTVTRVGEANLPVYDTVWLAAGSDPLR